ncbi:MAG: redoxin family protein [Bacteroidetes bacterium]|nr:redoxin family protein [Bacteroidota bacterium]
MNLRYILHFILIFCLAPLSKLEAQIEVAELIKTSNIAASSSNKLYFIDFWATWCGPCIVAKEQLTVLQNQFPNDFYIVSLTEENANTVDNFLKRKPTKLAVATDFYQNNFRKYAIESLPYGILFNANGEVLWQGRSPELSAETITNGLRNTKARVDLFEFLKIGETTSSTKEDYIPESPLEIKKLLDKSDEFYTVNQVNYIKLSGSLNDIVSFVLNVPKNQVSIDDTETANSYEVYINQSMFDDKERIFQFILNQLNLTVVKTDKTGKGFKLKVLDDSLFWDTNQIDWGHSQNKYLISDTDITADDVSLKELSQELSRVLNTPINISNENATCLKMHDWEVHYKYDMLMKMGLLDNFGIEINESDNVSFTQYTITKKTPQ